MIQVNNGIQMREWQKQAISSWIQNQHRGIISVATGGGKTIFAMFCISHLFNKSLIDYCIIVVPTITLRDQWYVNLLNSTNIEQDLKQVLETTEFTPSIENELADLFAPVESNDIPTINELVQPVLQHKRFIESISDAMRAAMQRYPEMIIMGQDIAEYGGAFKITEGFVDQFGKQRIRNTP
ncbi:MAG: hypothetical protein RIQ98_363, partial [Bacteroidota bacterium]